MGTEAKTDEVSTTRWSSWRDALAADYELRQATLAHLPEEGRETEEFF